MRKYLYTLIFIFLFGNPFILNAHNIIQGKVVGEESNAPLSGATIILKGSSEGSTTDEWGNFSINTDYASGILVVSYIGYKSEEIGFTSHTEFLVISLKPTIVDLSTVSVSAGRLTPMVSIAQVDLNVRSVNTSQDVLRIVPGLFIAQHAGGGKSEQIFLRGFDADHGTDVDVSVDGIPVNMVSQAHGQGYADLHWLIPELIREVDFAKGPYYADHGDFNTAGYVSFKTINTLEHNLIKLEAGQFNTLRTVGLFNLLGEKAKQSGKNAFVGMEYYLTDGPFDNPQNFNRLNMIFKYNQIVDQNNMFTIMASLFNSKWDQSGQVPLTAVNDGTITRWGSMDPSEGGNTQRYNFSIKSTHQLSSGGIFNNQLYFTRYFFDLYSNFTFFLEDSINGDQIRQKEKRNLFGYNGEYLKSYSLAKNNTIETSFGGGFRYDNIQNSQLLHTRKRYTIIDTSNFGNIYETSVNLYGQMTWFKNKWMVNIGLRLDGFKFEYLNKTFADFSDYSKYQILMSPKLNVSFDISKNAQLYLKLGRGFHSNDARVATRNNSLPTLPVATGTDFGINFKPAHRIIINAAIWYMYLQSELVWSGDAGTWEPSGRTNRYGIDLSLRWQIMNWLFFDGDVNYCIPRLIDEPKGFDYLPLSPILTSTGGLTFDHSSGWSSSLRYRYMSKRPADETASVYTQAYLIFDFKVNYRFKKWIFDISIENLLNADWNEAQFANDYRITSAAKPEYGLTFTPGMPFFAKAGISFSF